VPTSAQYAAMRERKQWRDDYSCNDQELREGTFPDFKPNRNRHEHFHHEGAYYWHIHKNGGVPHYHLYDGTTHLEEETDA
jgi:hypothetical protein